MVWSNLPLAFVFRVVQNLEGPFRRLTVKGNVLLVSDVIYGSLAAFIKFYFSKL